MRKWLIRIVVIVLLVAAVYTLRATYFAPRPVVVSTIAVSRGVVESTVTNSKGGTVRARRRAKLSTEIGGRVVAIPLREGELASRGDLLLQLDDSSQQARVELSRRELETIEAQRQQACLSSAQAARELQRNQALAERQIISENLLDRLQSTAETTAAACAAALVGIEAARAAVDLASTELGKVKLVAPFDGIIAELNTELGEWITPSPPAMPIPAVVDLIDPTSIYISAPMDEVDSARIHSGQQVKVTIDPFPDQVFSGRVVRVAPYVLDIETQNRTVEVEVELDDEEFASSLLPGTSADVEIILETRAGVLRIPTRTLMEGDSVMLLEDGFLVTREVSVGLRNWNYVEITGGLSDGEAIVTSLDLAEVQPGAMAVAEDGGPAGS